MKNKIKSIFSICLTTTITTTLIACNNDITNTKQIDNDLKSALQKLDDILIIPSSNEEPAAQAAIKTKIEALKTDLKYEWSNFIPATNGKNGTITVKIESNKQEKDPILPLTLTFKLKYYQAEKNNQQKQEVTIGAQQKQIRDKLAKTSDNSKSEQETAKTSDNSKSEQEAAKTFDNSESKQETAKTSDNSKSEQETAKTSDNSKSEQETATIKNEQSINNNDNSETILIDENINRFLDIQIDETAKTKNKNFKEAINFLNWKELGMRRTLHYANDAATALAKIEKLLRALNYGHIAGIKYNYKYELLTNNYFFIPPTKDTSGKINVGIKIKIGDEAITIYKTIILNYEHPTYLYL